VSLLVPSGWHLVHTSRLEDAETGFPDLERCLQKSAPLSRASGATRPPAHWGAVRN